MIDNDNIIFLLYFEIGLEILLLDRIRQSLKGNKYMDRRLYLECYSGISGDMMVASLLDLGADEKVLMEVLNSLPLKDFHVKISRVLKSGIDACDFDVVLEDQDNHDHDMEYLYGHLHGEHVSSHSHSHDHHNDGECSHDYDHHNDGEHSHDHEHNHDGEHSHEHDHHHDGEHSHHHEHRGMKEITDIINRGTMTDGARELAFRIFDILAHAESKAHNVPVEEVHFHEVGAVDSIVDIVSIAVCLDNLGIKECVVTHLTEGKGTVRCQHGILPVPVPAVLNIVSDNHIPIDITDIMGELVTPTGAATVAAICTSHELPKTFTVEKIGLGAGKRQYECAGILRAMLIDC